MPALDVADYLVEEERGHAAVLMIRTRGGDLAEGAGVDLLAPEEGARGAAEDGVLGDVLPEAAEIAVVLRHDDDDDDDAAYCLFYLVLGSGFYIRLRLGFYIRLRLGTAAYIYYLF